MKIKFSTEEKPEPQKQCIIKYKCKGDNQLHYEIGSAYFYQNEWWVNFYNPYTFSKKYEVLGWSYYNFGGI